MNAALVLVTGIMGLSLFSGCAGSGSEGTTPRGLGHDQGRLSPCPDSPNCVSSQAEDPQHAIKPLTYEGSRAEAVSRLITVLESIDRMTVEQREQEYIRAVARTRVFKFADDLEFYFPDDEPVIHVRSASRVGHSDLGVNRKRMEDIRSRFKRAD